LSGSLGLHRKNPINHRYLRKALSCGGVKQREKKYERDGVDPYADCDLNLSWKGGCRVQLIGAGNGRCSRPGPYLSEYVLFLHFVSQSSGSRKYTDSVAFAWRHRFHYPGISSSLVAYSAKGIPWPFGLIYRRTLEADTTLG
jgi:hypothetical protein